MELYWQTDNLTIIGVQVETFPNGIKEAFESLMKILGSDRDYYGVSWQDESDNIKYYASPWCVSSRTIHYCQFICFVKTRNAAIGVKNFVYFWLYLLKQAL